MSTTTLLAFALVLALAANVAAWIVAGDLRQDRNEIQSRAESHCQRMNAAVSQAQDARNEAIHWKRLHDALLVRQQKRRTRSSTPTDPTS